MIPFFSITIPLYNKENFIENTLQSVFNQTFQDFEIIIVNDGSTDNSLEKAKNALLGYENHTIIHQKNKGLSATRNKGISIAKGKIIALLDADDIWDIGFLSEIYNLWNKFPEASLYGTDYLEKYSNTNVLEPKKNLDASLKNKSFLVENFFNVSLFQLIVSQSNFAFKTEVFKTIKFNDTIDFGEDVEFYIKSNLKYKFAYTYRALATIHLNIPNQMTSKNYKGKRLPDFDAFEQEAATNPSLKKFLDYNRYFFLINSRIFNDKATYNLMAKHINYNNLSTKQKFLLKSPLFLLKLLKFIKKIFLRYNIRLTSFND